MAKSMSCSASGALKSWPSLCWAKACLAEQLTAVDSDGFSWDSGCRVSAHLGFSVALSFCMFFFKECSGDMASVLGSINAAS